MIGRRATSEGWTRDGEQSNLVGEAIHLPAASSPYLTVVSRVDEGGEVGAAFVKFHSRENTCGKRGRVSPPLPVSII